MGWSMIIDYTILGVLCAERSSRVERGQLTTVFISNVETLEFFHS